MIKTLLTIILVVSTVACSSPTAPQHITAGQELLPAIDVVSVPSVPNGGEIGTTSRLDGSACPVSTEDVDHARRILRILTTELERSVEMRFSLIDYSAPYTPSGRELHGRLNYGPASGTWMILEGALAPKTLKFGSTQAAGWALWEAAGQLTITADIYVNGVKVIGCTPRVGKITGRIDLDGL